MVYRCSISETRASRIGVGITDRKSPWRKNLTGSMKMEERNRPRM